MNNPDEQPVRCDAIFKGNVQGVGFRRTVEQFAKSYAITGYIENLADSNVHLVAEGKRTDVSSLIHTVLRIMASYISGHDEAWSHRKGEFHDFTIRRRAP
jgi:acylphosphatase